MSQCEDSPPPSAGRQRYLGPDRRRVDRAPTPRRVIGRARVAATFPKTKVAPFERGVWFPVVERNPDVSQPPLEGYVWVALGRRLQLVWSAWLELEEGPDGET
jgi:hypothetical protein